MLSRGDALATWQLQRPPAEMKTGEPQQARKLQDHRASYLTYEGPVSRNRGEVTRVDQGEYEVLTREDSRLVFRLVCAAVNGRFELTGPEPSSNVWSLRRLDES